jgi:transposase-like protein
MVVEETLAYYAFPEEHWRRIRTNNPRERILREGGAPTSWARSLTVNRRSTLPG